MDRDEQAIRTLVATWLQATAARDLDRVLALMDDDVVFLGPGRPSMRKDGFAAAARAREQQSRVEGSADIQEIRVFGDWAFCWNELTVTVRPPGSGEPVRMSGPALSILRRKADGEWVIHRDANMVSPAT
jgi:uncharacterized protein (TIGR02246 family)